MNAPFPTRAQERDAAIAGIRERCLNEYRNWLSLSLTRARIAREYARWSREYRAKGWHVQEARYALEADKMRKAARGSIRMARAALNEFHKEVYHAH